MHASLYIFPDLQTNGARTEKPTEEDERKDCITALCLTESISDPEKIIDRRGAIASGTCQWIENVSEFKSWLADSKRLLWILGGPGKGKTFLSIYIFKNLPTMEKNSTPLVLQYFCEYSDNRRNTAQAVLSGLIYQLLDWGKRCKSPNNLDCLYKEILGPFRTRGKDLFSRFYDLWDIFQKMVNKLDERIYVVSR